MGRRSQPRKQVEVPVRIFGTDKHGQTFSEKARIVNASRNGAELADVRPELKLDEIIGLTYGKNRVHFRVKWIGEAGTPRAGHVGLLNVAPEKPLWDFTLPADALDNYQMGSVEGRTAARFRCQNSIEVHLKTGASFWGTVADLSLGGCYVEMPIPLETGTKLRVGIWLGQNKAWAEAQVAHRTPGMGIGLKFIEISQEDRDQIRRYLDNLAPFAKKAARAPGASQSNKPQTKF
jgi:PilZ domain-containing protein